MACLSLAAAAADWKSVVDPPTEKIQWPADYKLDVPVPPSFFDPTATLADAGGPFVIVGRNGGRNEYRAVIDLRTGKTTAKLEGELRTDLPEALSRDGKRFAAMAQGVRGKELFVFDLENGGKTLAQLPAPARPESIQFVGTDKILIYSGRSLVQIYDLKSGKLLMETKPENNVWRNAMPASTPGGKYVAVPFNAALKFLDSETGQEVSSIPAPVVDQRGTKNFDAIAISPDGKTLAILTEHYAQRQFLLIDLATGKTLSDLPLKAPVGFARGPKLVWAADGSGLLLSGGSMIDTETAKVVFVPPGAPAARFPISLGTVVDLQKVGTDRKLVSSGLPADKLVAARTAVRSGGSSADALLPPLVEMKAEGAKSLTLPLEEIDWAVKLDKAAPTPGADRPIPVEFPLTGLQSLRVTGGTVPAAIYEIAKLDNFTRPDATQPSTLKKIDVLTGASTSYELPPGCSVRDVAADGKTVVTVDAATGTRADVFHLDGGKPTGLRPYDKEAEDHRKVSFAALPSPNRLVTVNPAGDVIGWDLAAGKMVYTTQAAGFVALGLTPGRQYLYGFQYGTFRFLDAATGEPAGDLVPGFQTSTTAAAVTLAIRPDGQEAAAVLTRSGVGMKLVRWNLATGKRIDLVSMTSDFQEGPKPVYVGQHLLFNNKQLYSPALKTMIWSYTATGPGWKEAAQRPDGRVWYTVGDDAKKGAVLVAADLPGSDAQARISKVLDGKESLIKPDTAVSLELDFSGTHAEAAMKKGPEEIKAAWANRDIEVTDDAKLKVRIKVKERDTGKRMEFTTARGFGPPSPFAKPTDLARTMEVTIETSLIQDGTVIWNAPDVTHDNHPPQGRFSVPKEDMTLDGFLVRRMWDTVPEWAAATLPSYATRVQGRILTLPGRATLAPTGVVAVK
ncbi:WD-40 repeat protein [Fimbriiglobus ruber]|uniref:WD-40 repeat protein n=1 Tax=Fimbriiglobus ruber TaxID=1908690 RepID=A0A225DBE7_9BACT|nr:WD-40 repeat protein [Fimbriiglobus ruber]